MAKQLNVNLAFSADTSQAEANLRNLKATLNSIAATDTTGLSMNAPIQSAITAAKQLEMHLNNAFDVKTGNLNLNKFQASLTSSGQSLKGLTSDLLKSGMAGEQAFLQLSTAISSSNIQIKQAEGLLGNLWTTMKNTARWQLSSTMLHGFMGAVQKAYGYAKDLNTSLNDIRIVTGYSADEMAKFAERANKAAKQLSATTTEYTNASLIYYQQGLSDEEVKTRTDITIKMANASRQSAEVVSDQLTAVWNNFAKGGENLEYFADVMTALGASTASSTEEIAAGLEKFAAIAETVGLSYEYSTAALATITANTRQSADVVGNALKTLFARIQGLKLGETLEDGVNLNKYSEALAAVGVDVLTANGELRAMDDILDDLAAKWDTIGKAEQTALAQTVAGVRQYTQLVALMENWDDMETNLQTAYNAEGALQEQADIYAESWEAARDRTRAAFEDLYNNVLDDEMFIDMTDAAGDLVNAIAGIAEGLGGMKGILLLISTLATQAFSKNIGNALDLTGNKILNLKNGIIELSSSLKALGRAGLKTLFYNKNQVSISKGDGQNKFQQDYLSMLNQASSLEGATAGFRDQAKSLEQITRLQNQIDANAKNLTAAERERLSIQLQQVQALSAQKAEIQDQIQLNQVRQQGLAQQDAENFYGAMYDQDGASGKFAMGLGMVVSDTGTLANNLNSLINMLGEAGAKTVKWNSETQQIVASEEALLALRQQAIDQYSQVNTLNTQINAILTDSSLDEKTRVEQVQALINNETNLKNVSSEIRDIYKNSAESVEQITQAMSRAAAQARQMGQVLNVNRDTMEQARQLGQEQGENFRRNTQYANQYNNAVNNVKTSLQNAVGASLSLGNSISKGISAVSSFAMAANMVSNAINSWGNPDISWTQKLLNITMALGSVMGVVMTVMNGFSNSLTAITTKYGLMAGAEQLLSNKTFQTTLSYRAAMVARKKLTKEQAAAELVTKFGITQAEAEAAITTMVANAKFYQAATTKGAGIEAVKAAGAEAMDASASAMASAATWGYVKSKIALAGSFLMAHPYILAFTVAIAALIAIFALVPTSLEKAEKKLEDAQQNFKKVSEEAKEASNKVKELSSAWDDLANKANALDDMVEGSLEWKQALIEVNGQMLDLIDKYPELAKYIKIVNGQVTMDQDGYEAYLDMQMAEAERKAGNAMVAQAGVTETQARVNYEKAAQQAVEDAIKVNRKESSWRSVIKGDYLKSAYWIREIPELVGQGRIGFDKDGNLKAIDTSLQSVVDLLSKISGITDIIASLLNIKQAGQASIEAAKTNAILTSNSSLLGETDYDNSMAAMFYHGNKNADISSYSDRTAELYKNTSVRSAEMVENYMIDHYGADWREQGYTTNADNTFGFLNAWSDLKITGPDETGSGTKKEKISWADMVEYRDQYIAQQASTMTEEDFAAMEMAQMGQRDFFKAAGLVDSQIDEVLAGYYGSGEKKYDFSNLSQEDIDNITNMSSAIAQEDGIRWGAVQEAIDNYIKERSEANIQESAEWWANKEQNDANELQEELTEAELSSEDYEAYVDQIMEIDEAVKNYNGTEEERRELAKKIAKENIKTANSMKKLQKVFKDYGDVLKKGDKTSFEYAKAMNAVKTELKELTGVEFDSDWLETEENLKLVEEMSNGSVEALDKIRIEAAKKIMLDVDTTGMSEGVENAAAYLTMWADKIANTPIEQRATLDTTQFIESLNQMLSSGAMTAEQVQSYLDNVGYQAEYSEITKNVPGPSFGYSGYIDFDGLPIDPIKWSAYGSGSQTVTVPQIKSVNNTGVTGGGGGSNVPPSSGGGGGGGGGSKPAQKKNSSDKERYHTLTNQLEDISKEFDAISDAADKAFGQEKLDLIDAQIAKLEEEKEKQKELIDALENDLVTDKAIMETYYKDVFGSTGTEIKFDARGNISNFDEIQDAMYAEWDRMTDLYNEDDEEWQVFEKKYEQFEKYLEQYEETYDKLKDEEEKLREQLYQELDLELQKIQYQIDLKLNLSEDNLAYLDYQLNKIDDDAFKAAEAIGLIDQQLGELYNQANTYKTGIREILIDSLDSEVEADLVLKGVENGDYSMLQNSVFTEAQIEQIKEYRDGLLDVNEQMRELKDDVFNRLTEAFDAWNEKLDKGIEKVEHYGNLLNSFKNIVDITGQDVLGISDDLMEDLNNKIVDNAIDNLEAVSAKNEAIQQSLADAQSNLAQAEADLAQAKLSGDAARIESAEEDVAHWTELVDTVNEEAMASSEALLDTWANTIEAIQAKFEASVDNAIKKFHEMLGGEDLADQFEKQQNLDEGYLKDYQQIYELSKMTRDINNSIDDTKSLQGKQKLKGLLEDINKIQKEGLEMSEYDLEYMQAEYELRLAEIALEETQNAKDTMVLKRDNEGNYSYVYTSSTDAVDEAQQKYEDALYKMQDLSQTYLDEMSSKIIEVKDQMAEDLKELSEKGLAPEEFEKEKAKIIEYYTEIATKTQGEINKAIENNQTLYEEDIKQWEYATGQKQKITDDFVQSYSDSVLGQLLGSSSELADFGNYISEAASIMSEELGNSYAEYLTNMNKAQGAAGVEEEFADLLAGSITKIGEKSDEAAAKVGEMKDSMLKDLESLSDQAMAFAEQYATGIQPLITANEKAVEGITGMIAALSGLDGLSVSVQGLTNLAQLSVDTKEPTEKDEGSSAASGGYTGEWGSGGRKMWVHEKELILDQNDTSNLLSAISLTRKMLQTIDLNAMQASAGIGFLAPAGIKEESKQILEQEVHITAEFPNVQDKNEIAEAIDNIINLSAQYANRK